MLKWKFWFLWCSRVILIVGYLVLRKVVVLSSALFGYKMTCMYIHYLFILIVKWDVLFKEKQCNTWQWFKEMNSTSLLMVTHCSMAQSSRIALWLNRYSGHTLLYGSHHYVLFVLQWHQITSLSILCFAMACSSGSLCIISKSISMDSMWLQAEYFCGLNAATSVLHSTFSMTSCITTSALSEGVS